MSLTPIMKINNPIKNKVGPNKPLIMVQTSYLRTITKYNPISRINKPNTTLIHSDTESEPPI